jgi:hypothetical protein
MIIDRLPPRYVLVPSISVWTNQDLSSGHQSVGDWNQPPSPKWNF